MSLAPFCHVPKPGVVLEKNYRNMYEVVVLLLWYTKSYHNNNTIPIEYIFTLTTPYLIMYAHARTIDSMICRRYTVSKNFKMHRCSRRNLT